MKVKFQGGPMKGQYQEIRNAADRLQVQAAEQVDPNMHWHDPQALMKIKRGDYARSNKTLKNGATVYIWMGWYGG